MDKLKEEYFHLGTDNIYEELWLYPQMEQIYTTYIKPYGGLWASEQDSYTLSTWIGYKEEETPISYFDSLKCCLIKFKEHCRFLKLETKNDYKNLRDSGFVWELNKPIQLYSYGDINLVSEVLDYEKLCDYYDLMYVSPGANISLSDYSINTMFALNPESIEYFKPISVDFYEHKILSEGEKKFIPEVNKKHILFLNYVENLFEEIESDNYEDYIKKLYNETKRVIEEVNKISDSISVENDISIKYYIETAVRNVYRKKYIKAQQKFKTKRLIKK